MRVGIVGSGAMGLGTAGLLHDRGHEVTVFSPRPDGQPIGERVIRFEGKVTGNQRVRIVDRIGDAVDAADCVIVAVPAFAYKHVIDLMAPRLSSRQVVLFGAHYSFAGLYLSKLVRARGVNVPIVGCATTAVQARRPDKASINVTTIRTGIDAATIPVREQDRGLACGRELLGNVFIPMDDVLTVTLNNVNAQAHTTFILCNFTRIERGEDWPINQNYTEHMWQLISSMDAERTAIGKAYGKTIKTIIDHLRYTYGVNVGSGFEARAKIEAQGLKPMGPKSLNHRYFTEDLPYGLAVIERVGRKAGLEPVLYKAAIDIVSALHGTRFYEANDILDALDFDRLTKDRLLQLCSEGY